MSSKSYKGELPKPEAGGRWRPVVGVDGRGESVRFQVGTVKHTTPAEAKRRLDAIRDLYDRQCHELGLSHWAFWTLTWAKKIASLGVPLSVVSSKHSTDNPGQAAEELDRIAVLQKWGVPIQIADPELIASGVGFLEQRINDAVKQALEKLNGVWGKDIVEQYRHESVPTDLKAIDAALYHDTLDAYINHLSSTGRKDKDGHLLPYVRKCQERIGWLKVHENVPLWKINLPYIENAVAYWRNRPPTTKKDHCSKFHATIMAQELFRFLHWLDTTPLHKWKMPSGVDKIKRTPIALPEDIKTTAFNSIHKTTYTPDQLAIICQFTNDFGRALIGVCVNCAFGASEVGQWQTVNYSLYKAHPYADKLGSRP